MQKDYFTATKEAKIRELYKKRQHVRTREESYWLNKMFYDEYYVYNSDSALAYVERNLAIAYELNNKEWRAVWEIKKYFLLFFTGMLTEGFKKFKKKSKEELTAELQVEE